MNPIPEYKVHVLSNLQLAPNAFFIKTTKPFNFKAGQVISVSTDLNDKNTRLYSICSGEKEDFLGVLFSIAPKGYLTNKLKKLKAGDALYISKPFGHFLQGYTSKSICIATGTGIAPFYSLFKSKPSQIHLIHGSRYMANMYFTSEFRDKLHSYVTCCSGEKNASSINTRITDYLKNQELPLEVKYYLCGVNEMVIDVRDILLQKDIPFKNIHTEIYF